ncbi:ESPR-type extended signal peptide-containing protein [Rhodoferax lithotrophicus]|nr:ESPR-type extended signal peptide-containing protein [Rhodoferax sp. MIZ03]
MNHLTNAWVCCSENAKDRGKSGPGAKAPSLEGWPWWVY